MVVSGSSAVAAQQQSAAAETQVTKSVTEEELLVWIADLGAADFKTRLHASRQLQQSGDVAIVPLRNAIADATGESRLRMESLLKQLERDSFVGRLETLLKTPSANNARGLPEWERFAKSIGDSQDDILFFARLLKAEEKLFATAARKPQQLSELLEVRAAELIQTTRLPPNAALAAPFSVDSYAALLLLAGNNSTRLLRGTSTDISALLNHAMFVAALGQEDGGRLRQLVGGYILRERIAVVVPLQFARSHRMPQGLQLARKVVQTALRGNNGMQAMMLLLEQGTSKDAKLLEAVFGNRGVLFKNVNPRQLTSLSTDYSDCNGDLALAVAIRLRGRDPRDFGFGGPTDRTQPFRFSYDSTGFESEAAREEAKRKYAAEFSVNSTPQ